MARKLYDLAVKTGSYTDRDGNEKSRYLNIGAVFEGEKGPYAVMSATFSPAGVPRKDGSDSIMVSLFAPREEGQGQQKQKAPPRHNNFDDESIPF